MHVINKLTSKFNSLYIQYLFENWLFIYLFIYLLFIYLFIQINKVELQYLQAT